MNFICAVLISVISSANAEWIKDLISPNGWDMGHGLSLHLQRNNNHNASFFENHLLQFRLNGYGFSVAKAPKKDAVQFGIYNNLVEEGRKKEEYGLATVVMGYKMATIISMVLAGMGGLVLKALGVAKIALVTSAILFIIKLFHHEKSSAHHQHLPHYVEIEHPPENHADVIPEATSGGGGGGGAIAGYHPSGAENYYSYANYIPSGMADNSVNNYGNMDGSADNSSLAGSHSVGRRRDLARRKSNSKIPLYTIHRYTVET